MVLYYCEKIFYDESSIFMDNNDFERDFEDEMDFQISNYNTTTPNGKYKKPHFTSLGSVILLIIAIILAFVLIIKYANFMSDERQRDAIRTSEYEANTTEMTTTSFDEYYYGDDDTSSNFYNSSNDYTHYSYRENYNSYTSKPKDEYNAKSYNDSYDFYEDHYDDFDDFEDADDYYEDNAE